MNIRTKYYLLIFSLLSLNGIYSQTPIFKSSYGGTGAVDYVEPIRKNPVNEEFKGEAEGEHLQYFNNGKIRTKYFIKNGNLQGDVFDFYNNGEIFVFQQFDQGEFNGKNYSLNENKDTIYIEVYKHDTLIFTKNLYYYKNGKIKEIISVNYIEDSSLIKNPFKNIQNRMNGFYLSDAYLKEKVNNRETMVCFYKSGIKQFYIEFVKAKYSGKYIEYFDTGQIKKEVICANNKFNGPYKRFYPNGNNKIETFCVNDKFNGLYKEFHSNDKIKIEAFYINGKFDGQYLEYDITGKIIKKKMYKNGKKVK